MFDVLPESRSQGAVLGPSAISTAVLAHSALVVLILAASVLARVNPGCEPPMPLPNDGIIRVIPPPLGDSELAGGTRKPPVVKPPKVPPAPVIEEPVQPVKVPDAPLNPQAPEPPPPDANSSTPGPPDGGGEADGSGVGDGPGTKPGTYGQPDGVPGSVGPLGPRTPSGEDSDILLISGDVQPPVLIRRVEPEYPEVGRITRTQGVVILEAVIGIDGRVESLTVLKSIPLLDGAATRAVRQWVYRPSKYKGLPVKVYLTIRVEFRLA